MGYFEWLCGKVGLNENSYELAEQLYNTDFVYLLHKDGNRATDGIELRAIFRDIFDEPTDTGDKPCSVLEMMVALSSKCESMIMHDAELGDRTPLWFNTMMHFLGLDVIVNTNGHVDHDYVSYILHQMMYRLYGPDGSNGCLFHVKDKNIDLRNIEIWYQLSFYLNDILERE